jgi:hypothetical protein
MQIRLTPELEAFVAANSGEGTHFSSAEEFIAAVLQEKRERLEVTAKTGDVSDPATVSDPAIAATSPAKRHARSAPPRTRMAR